MVADTTAAGLRVWGNDIGGTGARCPGPIPYGAEACEVLGPAFREAPRLGHIVAGFVTRPGAMSARNRAPNPAGGRRWHGGGNDSSANSRVV